MNDMIAKLREQFEDFSYQTKVQLAKLFKRPLPKDPKAVSTESAETYEINLVPAVKTQLIRTQKIRNHVLFACIVVSCVALGVVLVLFSIKSGQDIAMSRQDKRLENLSGKLNSYSELDDLLTIQNQLSRYNDIINNRQMISRAFGAIGVMLPQVGGNVSLSELRVNLETNAIAMEGQADALAEPLIDYRVLEAFKKSVGLTKYDYGRFVDMDGKELPTQCIKESNADGNALREGDSYYAWWDLRMPGCEGVRVGESTRENGYSNLNSEDVFHFSKDAEVEMGKVEVEEERTESITDSGDESNGNTALQDGVAGIVDFEQSLGDELGLDNNETRVAKVKVEKEVPVRVKIWRTPRFDRWYKDKQMSLDGVISGIEHFQSACYQYSGAEVTSRGKSSVRWASTNECYLAKDGLSISSSSNGRDSSSNLVLRFSATATFDDAFFRYANKHMIAIGPMGQNVTDSFVQIGGMFAQEAEPCAEGDTECLGNTQNTGGQESSTDDKNDNPDRDENNDSEANSGDGGGAPEDTNKAEEM